MVWTDEENDRGKGTQQDARNGDYRKTTKRKTKRFCVGDRFYLCENKILCEYDYEERLVFANMAYNPSSLAHIKRQTSHLPPPPSAAGQLGPNRNSGGLPVVGVGASLPPLCTLGSNGEIVDRRASNGETSNHNSNGFLPATTDAMGFDSK
ncbi:uncharacterized protein [Anabrus simplex]|uniref:uncharacterized protein n=1 Tax=Anabrus simplex TaxID=316456 RepID=UPI0035A3CA9C